MPRPIPQRTVVTHYKVRDIADDLSELTVEHQEAVPGRRPKRTRRVSMSYAMIDKQSLRDLELTQAEARVLHELVAVADYKIDEGKSRMSTALLAERTGMAGSAASRALTSLQARAVIFKEATGLWMVNPWYSWVGPWELWDKTARDYPEPQWKR